MNILLLLSYFWSTGFIKVSSTPLGTAADLAKILQVIKLIINCPKKNTWLKQFNAIFLKKKLGTQILTFLKITVAFEIKRRPLGERARRVRIIWDQGWNGCRWQGDVDFSFPLPWSAIYGGYTLIYLNVFVTYTDSVRDGDILWKRWRSVRKGDDLRETVTKAQLYSVGYFDDMSVGLKFSEKWWRHWRKDYLIPYMRYVTFWETRWQYVRNGDLCNVDHITIFYWVMEKVSIPFFFGGFHSLAVAGHMSSL